jgi:glyoxylase-like metal-dependent hydrolase (beta-lactamase superfamily II)
MEIASGIHDIPIGLDAKLGPFAPKVYLVTGNKGAVIDAAYGSDEGMDNLIKYVGTFPELKLAYVIITHAHPDHISGATGIHRRTGASIVLHSAEKADIPIDKIVEEGDTISLGGIDLEVIHTPGHNPGHICLYIRQEKIMFTGDHVLANSTTALQPPWGDMAQYIDSLRKLLGYEIELMLPAHGPPITEPRRRIEYLIRHRLEREEQVVKLLGLGKGSVTEIVAQIYPELTGFLHALAVGQISAHLVKLEQEGKVCARGNGKSAHYTLN